MNKLSNLRNKLVNLNFGKNQSVHQLTKFMEKNMYFLKKRLSLFSTRFFAGITDNYEKKLHPKICFSTHRMELKKHIGICN